MNAREQAQAALAAARAALLATATYSVGDLVTASGCSHSYSLYEVVRVEVDDRGPKYDLAELDDAGMPSGDQLWNWREDRMGSARIDDDQEREFFGVGGDDR